MTARKSEKDREIARLKRELNKANNDLAEANEKLKLTRLELRSLKSEKNKKRANCKADRGTKQIAFRTAWGYKYNELVLKLAVLLRSRLPICGSRPIVVILEILNECFKRELFDCIPSNQVIEDWCERAGLDMHTKVRDQFADKDYVTITDESISAGKQKLLLQLAVPADCTDKPLSHSDVSIVGMSVSPSWTGESVKAEMDRTPRSIGRKPLYSVSDNGYNVTPAGMPGYRITGISAILLVPY